MRFPFSFVAALACGASASTWAAAAATDVTVNDAGDAVDASCPTTCTLRAAIESVAPGGSIDFAPELLPATITLAQPKGALLIDKPLTILGPGPEQLAISANLASRVLYVESGFISPVQITGVTLRDGRIAGSAGVNGGKETGGGGGSGVLAVGGCILAKDSSLYLDRTDIRNCVAQGGIGGHGGSGVPHGGLGGPGGAGGPGGPAHGGGIYFITYFENGYSLVLHDSSVTDSQAIAGAGGAGGAGGTGTIVGSGGSGGEGGLASGGAIEWYIGGDIPTSGVLLDNSTVADSAAIGGHGGNGGVPGGDGGNGGPASGGLLAFDRISVSIEFATLANGGTQGGAGGSGGTPGLVGSPLGAAIYRNKALPGGVTALSTVIAGSAAAPLCSSTMYPSGHNLDQDSTCGFDMQVQGSLAVFRPPDPGAGRPHYMPVYRSAVIDAATSCFDFNILPVDADQRGTARPQGSACDLGAIEADYIFVGEFD